MDNKNLPHTFDERGLESTKNLRGFMHTLNEISQQFIEFAPTAPGLVVDIGAAYGIATIPVINKHVKVVACDMEKSHLDELTKRIEPELQSYLTTIQGQFPRDLNFEKNSIGAILLSHILHFLNPEELDYSFQLLSQWLAAEGKIFIACYTPYMDCFKRFIPIYEKRLSLGLKWPCWVENNARDYLDVPEDILRNLPSTMNYLDLAPLIQALESNDFYIEKAEYLDPKKNNISDMLILDGREWSGIIAVKK